MDREPDLVKFALIKLGWKRLGDKDQTKPLHKPSKDYPGTILDDWGSKGPHPRWENTDGERYFLCECRSDMYMLPDLSSWNLLGQGLAAFHGECNLEFDGLKPPRSDGHFGIGCVILDNSDWRRSQKVFFQAVEEIPLSFWKAWHQLEQKKS